MTAPFTTPRPEPKRDRWGRYLLPDPHTGKERAWTRATTFAKTISDMYGLARWQERMVAKGIATRSDLYALAAATNVDDKTKFDKICEDAKEAAKASSGANLGTALHAFTEQVDAGEDVAVPEPWDKDIAAYTATVAQAGLVMHPQWIERIVVLPEYGVAGTLDRLVGPTLRVGDVKTGKDLSYSWGEICIQLALYAASRWMWNPDTKTFERMPQVDQEQAIVLHLPVGKARCDLYTVDIAAGIEAVQLCQQVRDWRGRKDLAVPYTPEPARTPLGDPLLGRILATTTEADLEALWHQTWRDWGDRHNQAARKHKTALQTSAGTAGGKQEKESTAA